jgi:hypothetical protein
LALREFTSRWARTQLSHEVLPPRERGTTWSMLPSFDASLRPVGDLDLPAYRQRLATLAAQGIYIGTSFWKYSGWCGMIYDERRYLTRQRFT